jgi:predicted short-subunit dehydrogenase-like oxidoreductase (DUF2520 family)
MNRYTISFAGAGRVGGAICRELFKTGHHIEIIVSETGNSGRKLADACNARWSTDLIFPQSTKIIIVTVPDQKLKKVLNDIICPPGTLVLHTAGSHGLEVFPDKIEKKGIFYPLQTFTHGRNIRFKDLPFLLEASDNQSSAIMKDLADSILGKVYFVNTMLRTQLHLAAVFVCNFTNHMLTEGKNIVLEAGFPFEILIPLIEETISKALSIGPENSQTGPAFRNDHNTIKKHLELLSFSPERKKIYKELTQSIIKYYKKS